MRSVLKVLLPVLVLAVGAGAAVMLVRMKPEPPTRPPAAQETLVRVMAAQRTDEPITVVAMGTVVPARMVELQPQVSGRIQTVSPNLVPGGRFHQDEPVAWIEREDYLIALEQAKAELARAEFELDVEEGRQTVAKREWDLLGRDVASSKAGRELALRVPHLANATAAVKAAQSRVDQATLNLRRTTVKAPFNAVVRAESVEVGQIVNPQTRLATLCGTDRFWVRVAVPVDRLRWIDVPQTQPSTQPATQAATQPGATQPARPLGAQATVIHDAGPASTVTRSGHVVRLLSDVDPAGRMARVLVEVPDPLGLKDESPRPLLLDAYVRVEIKAGRLADVVVVPRAALREGDQVWIMTADRRLEIRKNLDIRWRRPDAVLVGSGIAEGERIVTSRIGTPLEGMKLKAAPTVEDPS